VSDQPTLEQVHETLAGVSGEISFALVRRRIRPDRLRSMATRARAAAGDLERIAAALDERLGASK